MPIQQITVVPTRESAGNSKSGPSSKDNSEVRCFFSCISFKNSYYQNKKRLTVFCLTFFIDLKDGRESFLCACEAERVGPTSSGAERRETPSRHLLCTTRGKLVSLKGRVLQCFFLRHVAFRFATRERSEREAVAHGGMKWRGELCATALRSGS